MLSRSLLAALAVCATGALAPTVATAAPGSGSVSLTVRGGVLAGSGVKALAIAPAKKQGARIRLPIQSVTVGKAASVALRGGIRFKAGKRSLRLRAVRLKLSAGRVSVSARAGKSRVTIFATGLPKGKAKLDRAKTTARVTGARLVLTAKAARLLRKRLGVDGITAGRLGKLGVDARPRGAGGGGGGGAGGGSGGGPKAGPIKNEPPLLARPDGAVDVVGASLIWRPRPSWLCYVEEANALGGVTNGPVETLDCPTGGPRDLVASFTSFPFAHGWYHPPTGTAAIYFQGGVGFRYAAHGINFSSSNPEIEINGGASRAIFTFNGSQATQYDNQRGVLVDLHPNPIQTPAGGTVTYTDVPATVPADAGASVFAGFYGPNEPFGSLSVTFTTP